MYSGQSQFQNSALLTNVVTQNFIVSFFRASKRRLQFIIRCLSYSSLLHIYWNCR